jgi:hypothetical protein
MIERPLEGEHDPYYSNDISLVTEDDLFAVLCRQSDELRQLAAGLSPDRETYSSHPASGPFARSSDT